MNLVAVPAPLSFVHILDLHTVYGSDKHGPKIRFDIVNESFLEGNSGLYVITQGSKNAVVYCGVSDTRTFRNALLFNRSTDLHFHNTDRIRNEVSKALEAGNSISVHAQTEKQLRQQLITLGEHPDNLGSLLAIKKVLVRLMGPEW